MIGFVKTIQEIMGLSFFQSKILGNTLGDFILFVAGFLVFLILLKFIQWIVLSRVKKFAEKTKTDIDDTLIEIIKTAKPPFYSFLAFYFAFTLFLSFGGVVNKTINVILIVWVVYLAVKAAQILVDYITDKYIHKETDEGTRAAVILINKVARITLWVVALLVVLSSFGMNVNTVVAGLGIGGIAIAFALQKILGDVFSSFAIYFDKPFLIGDFIVVGEHRGTVMRIGIKTTRIKSLDGEEIVISNEELTSARIQNYKRMKDRRVVFGFGVVYATPNEQLREIPRIIKDIIEPIDGARFDRAHFVKFDDSSLTFEVVYYVESSDYGEYMNIQQEVNFRIKDEFDKMKIEMAYPTRTIYIAGNSGS